jgi:hypothetical protein
MKGNNELKKNSVIHRFLLQISVLNILIIGKTNIEGSRRLYGINYTLYIVYYELENTLNS